MPGMFVKRDWKPELLPEMTGSYQHLDVTLRNFPCLWDAKSRVRKFVSADFGYEFLMALQEQLGDFELLCAKMKSGATVKVFVTLAAWSPIAIELSGIPNNVRRQFNSDLADALIEAFKVAGLSAR